MCPIIKSAKKAWRQSFKRKTRHLQKMKELKNLLKKMKFLASEKKVKEAKKLLPRVYKVLDKAAKTGLIKENTASRNKSRITKLISKSR